VTDVAQKAGLIPTPFLIAAKGEPGEESQSA
jgi:hypothetical protein